MDWIIWLVVIVGIVAVVWWLLNRNSRGGADSSAAADTHRTTDTGAPGTAQATRDEPGAAAPAGTAAGAGHAASADETAVAPGAQTRPAAAPDRPADSAVPEPSAAEGLRPAPQAENAGWETHWSETPPQEPHGAAAHEPGHKAAHDPSLAGGPGIARQEPVQEAAAAVPVHHPEYTGAHAPTLPGAESAAAESVVESGGLADDGGTTADAGPAATLPAATGQAAMPPAGGYSRPEPAVPPAVAPEVAGLPPAEAGPLQSAPSVAGQGAAAGHGYEPSGHLALEQPYGEGSAAPAADGSGPEDFTVKGDATSMTYYEETSPDYEETRAEVWFLSPAHAEAAGFRPPRRTRR